jgi:hypothetical protein
MARLGKVAIKQFLLLRVIMYLHGASAPLLSVKNPDYDPVRVDLLYCKENTVESTLSMHQSSI